MPRRIFLSFLWFPGRKRLSIMTQLHKGLKMHCGESSSYIPKGTYPKTSYYEIIWSQLVPQKHPFIKISFEGHTQNLFENYITSHPNNEINSEPVAKGSMGNVWGVCWKYLGVTCVKVLIIPNRGNNCTWYIQVVLLMKDIRLTTWDV